MPDPDYVAIAETATDVGAPPASELMKALAGNPLAIAFGSDGAPINRTILHPYDQVLVGDGNDGVVYDFAVDGGVSSIVTPTIDIGYQYTLTFTAFSADSIDGSNRVRLDEFDGSSYINQATIQGPENLLGGPFTASATRTPVTGIQHFRVTLDDGAFDAGVLTLFRKRVYP